MKLFSPDIGILGAAVVITGPALLAGPGPEFGCVDACDVVSVPFNYFFPSKQIPMHSAFTLLCVSQDNKNTHHILLYLLFHFLHDYQLDFL
jgi:hypothetical protein